MAEALPVAAAVAVAVAMVLALVAVAKALVVVALVALEPAKSPAKALVVLALVQAKSLVVVAMAKALRAQAPAKAQALALAQAQARALLVVAMAKALWAPALAKALVPASARARLVAAIRVALLARLVEWLVEWLHLLPALAWRPARLVARAWWPVALVRALVLGRAPRVLLREQAAMRRYPVLPMHPALLAREVVKQAPWVGLLARRGARGVREALLAEAPWAAALLASLVACWDRAREQTREPLGRRKVPSPTRLAVWA